MSTGGHGFHKLSWKSKATAHSFFLMIKRQQEREHECSFVHKCPDHIPGPEIPSQKGRLCLELTTEDSKKALKKTNPNLVDHGANTPLIGVSSQKAFMRPREEAS